MKKRYRCRRLSPEEEELMQIVLLEEMDIQTWFGVLVIPLLSEEIIVYLQ